MNTIETYILNEIKRYRTLCFPLIDSENPNDVISIAKKVERLGASAILIGGSSIIDQIELSKIMFEANETTTSQGEVAFFYVN